MSQGFAAGLAWNIAGSGARAVAQFIGGVLLARLLGPEPFGIMAIGWIVIQYVKLIDPGMGPALIKHPNPKQDDLRFAVTMQLSVSLLLMGLLIGFAGPCAALMGDPSAAPIIQVLAILLPLGSFSQIGTAMLERKMQFREVQLANLIPYVVSVLLVGLPLALSGAGFWSLVTAVVTQALGTTVWIYLATRHPLAFKWSYSEWRSLFGFGAHASGASLANSISTTVDQIAVSHIAGPVDLGQYNRAAGLLTAPMLTITNALAVWIFPIFARAENPLVRRRQFLAAVPAAAGVTAIPFAVVGGAANTVVYVVYGAGWELAAAITQPIAFTMPALSLLTFSSTLLWSAGHVALDHRLQWVATAAMVVGMIVSVSTGGGPVELAWVVCGITWLRAGVLLGTAARIAGCGVLAASRTLYVIGFVAVSCGLAAHGIEEFGVTAGISPWRLLLPLGMLIVSGCSLSWWCSCRLGAIQELSDIVTAWRLNVFSRHKP